MSGLSDFLTQATAPWWGTPIGVLGGAGIAFTSTYFSDKRKRKQEPLESLEKAHKAEQDIKIVCPPGNR